MSTYLNDISLHKLLPDIECSFCTPKGPTIYEGGCKDGVPSSTRPAVSILCGDTGTDEGGQPLRFWRGIRPHYLRLESQGEEVRWLQRRLLELGYDPGPVDGYFGYQTHSAVMDFQRDFGLRVDAVAGPRLYELLNQSIVPLHQRVYVLAPGESLADAARVLETPVEALRYMNRLPARHRGYPGQRLICRSHYIAGALSLPESASLYSGRKALPMLSALAVPVGVVSGKEIQIRQPDEQVVALARRNGLDLWGVVTPAEHLIGETMVTASLEVLTAKRRYLQQVTKRLIAVSRDIGAGLWLDLGPVRWGDGPRLQRFARLMRESNAAGRLMISLPVPRSRAPKHWWLTDVDYASLAELADKVVLAAHYPGPLEGFAVFSGRLRALLQVVPAWKSLLGLSLRAEERDCRGRLLRERGYRQAITTAYLAGARPVWDAERYLSRAAIAGTGSEKDSTERVFWIPGRDAIEQRIHLVSRLNLAGLMLWPLGEEDVRIWDILRKRMQPQRQAT